MEIKLSDHFTYKRLLRFVLPSIGMMIFTSIYGVVDGFFVSNYVGKTEFAGKACFNGSSELMTNVSLSLVNMLYNL